MKFRFKKIGPIDEAELELGDLTIIAGRNNTGKTYIVYSLYGFLSELPELLRGEAGTRFLQSHFAEATSMSPEEVVSLLITEKQVSWNIEDEFLADEQARLLQELAREYSEHGIDRVFNTSQGRFSEACLELDLDRTQVVARNFLFSIPPGVKVSIGRAGAKVTIGYDGTKFSASLEDRESSMDLASLTSIVREAFGYLYPQILLKELYRPKEMPFIFSSARHSIPLFLNELDYVRSQVVRQLQQQEARGNGEPLEGPDPLRSTSRYAAPIHDNIDFVRSVPEKVEAYTNKLRNVLPIDIQKMMEGAFESRNGALRFTSIAESILDFDIPLQPCVFICMGNVQSVLLLGLFHGKME